MLTHTTGRDIYHTARQTKSNTTKTSMNP